MNSYIILFSVLFLSVIVTGCVFTNIEIFDSKKQTYNCYWNNEDDEEIIICKKGSPKEEPNIVYIVPV